MIWCHLICGAVRCCWKDVQMPKPYPREFGDDVVRVARKRESVFKQVA